MREFLTDLFDRAIFDPDAEGGPAIEYIWQPSDSKLVVIVGDNATGKSVVRRVIGLLYKERKVEFIGISMQARCGQSGMHGMAKACVYGDESYQSTGVLSSNTVSTGISTCEGRGSPHAIFWDEPDVGLSDNYAAGVGADIAEFTKNLPKFTEGVFLITHRKALLDQIVRSGIDHNYICLGPNPAKTLKEYIERPVVPASLEQLRAESHARFKKIQNILHRK